MSAVTSSGRGFWKDGDVGATIRAQDSVTKADTLIVGAMPAAGGTSRKHGHGWGQQEFEAGYIIPLGLGEDGQLARALNGRKTAAGRHDVSVDTYVAHSLRADGFDASEDGSGRGTPLVPVVQPYTLAIRGRGESHDLEFRQDGLANALLTPNGGRGGIGVGAIAHAFDARQSDVIQYGDHAGPLDTDGHSQAIAFTQNSRSEVREIGGDGTIVGAIAADHGMQQQNYVAFGGPDAGTPEADASSVLRALRGAVGAEAFAEWGSRILDPLQSPEILRAWLHGGSVRRAADEGKPGVDDGALSRAKELPAGELRLLWERGPDGRSPQGRELAKQLAVELGASLPQLPHQGASERLQVRRLTPREAERLQGFPDDWTLIDWRGKPAADGPRYKALGNSMAVPVMRYLLQRITDVENGR